jgi:hypothetical protein
LNPAVHRECLPCEDADEKKKRGGGADKFVRDIHGEERWVGGMV